jgi:hypothetical protein
MTDELEDGDPPPNELYSKTLQQITEKPFYELSNLQNVHDRVRTK